MSIAASMDHRVESLRKLVPRALRDFDADAVHDARVATRRLSAALVLLEPVLSKDLHRKFGRTLKKLRRRLGPLRDLDVILARLDKLHAPAGAVAWLHQQLQARQSEHRTDIGRKSSDKVLARLGTWWAIHGQIDDATSGVDDLLAESVEQQLAAFHERAVQEPILDPHPLRIAGKRLRYTLELAADHGRPLPKQVLRVFERLQDALGEWHDLVVFSQVIVRTSLDADLARTDPATAMQVLDLSRQALRRSGRSLAKFGRLWQAEGERLTAAIGEAFGRPSEPQTDPGPSPTDAPPAPQAPPAADPAGGPA